jgi:hypothetical protein
LAGPRLTQGRLNKLGQYINRSGLAEPGERSECDFALCCWAVKQGLDREEVWAQVQDVGKFAEGGRRYFDLTWHKADARVRSQIVERIARNGKPSRNGATPHRNGNGGPPPGSGGDNGPSGPRELRTIQGNKRQLRAVTAEALEAVLEHNSPPQVFQRGGLLTRLRVSPSTGAPYCDPFGEAALRGRLARVANWERVNDEGAVEECAPPREVVNDLASLPDWGGVPLLEAIVESPVFAPDGSLVATPGYDERAKVWYHAPKGLTVPPVPENPTADDLARAKALLLDELLGDFPFKDQASRANALAALLLPFVRPMIDGPTPLHLFDAPSPGTGKTLLALLVGIVTTGRDAEATTEGRDEDEWRKRLLAVLCEAPVLVLLDNLKRPLDSGALASALTVRVWKDRILGVSKTAALPVTCTWLATGNNTELSHEMVRRTVLIRLDSKTDQPWNRKGFRGTPSCSPGRSGTAGNWCGPRSRSAGRGSRPAAPGGSKRWACSSPGWRPSGASWTWPASPACSATPTSCSATPTTRFPSGGRSSRPGGRHTARTPSA